MTIASFIQTVCVQTAVYWGAPTDNGYGGYTFAAPVEIKCRWDPTDKIISDGKGKEIVGSAQILVTQDLEEQAYIFLGFLADLSTEQKVNPMFVSGAYQIKQVAKVYMIKSLTDAVRTVWI